MVMPPDFPLAPMAVTFLSYTTLLRLTKDYIDVLQTMESEQEVTYVFL